MAWLGGMGRGNIGTLIVALSLSVGFFAERPALADERKILVASFENIQVIGDMKVQVQTGKAPSAKAKGDKRVLDALKLERVGMTLRVRLQGALNNEQGVPMTQPLEVMLSTQAIKDMAVSGNGSLQISEVKQQDAARMLLAGNALAGFMQLAQNPAPLLLERDVHLVQGRPARRAHYQPVRPDDKTNGAALGA